MTVRKLKQTYSKTQKALPLLTACDSHICVQCLLYAALSRLEVCKCSLRFVQYVFDRKPLSRVLTSAGMHGWGMSPWCPLFSSSSLS